MTDNPTTCQLISPSAKTIRILLADDHRILREGLRGLLAKAPLMEVVGEAEDGMGAVQLSQKLTPDVVLMDISMQNLDGVKATRQITGASSNTKVIILSMHSGREYIAEAFRAGASGYLLKDSDSSDIYTAICAVVSNETYVCPKITAMMRDDYIQQLAHGIVAIAPPPLTPREREILQLMAEGNTTKEIAFSLKLSVKTVEMHRQRIMMKLNIHSIAELTKYAIREGLTSLDS